jgi:hypothetical protein
MNFLPATRAALACHALPLREPMQSRFSRAANTTDSIAAPAIFYWARGLKHIEIRAKNDEFWRCVA